MSFFDEDATAGALKAGLMGFGGSGKTYTGILLAIATRETLKLGGPIAMYDTEGGSTYVDGVVRELTGLPLLKKRARDLQTLLDFGANCQREGVAAAVVDSITHPWRELCDSYLRQINAARAEKRWGPLEKLEFQHWGPIKERWQLWTDFYLNSALSIVICGRAGFEYDNEVNEKGRRELVKTGVKMKTEGEMGFEPSLLVLMEQDQELVKDSQRPTVHRTATVLKDRFRSLDGRTVEFRNTTDVRKDYEAVKAFFAPHLEQLTPGGAHSVVDTQSRTHFEIHEGGQDNARTEMREREVLREEIAFALQQRWPGQTGAEKNGRLALIKDVFGRASWSHVESLSSSVLRAGRDRILAALGGGSAQDSAPTAVVETEITESHAHE